jgi:hypothetical protein
VLGGTNPSPLSENANLRTNTPEPKLSEHNLSKLAQHY